VAPSYIANSYLEGKDAGQKIGFPLVIRPSYTLGGYGGGFVMKAEDFDEALQRGLNASPTHEVLVEKAVLGWKEYELELLRDANDNVVIICTVENLDPMGIHTGDSITVAPAMTMMPYSSCDRWATSLGVVISNSRRIQKPKNSSV